jgi:nucleotide-binding universal stress UspA family protein
MRTRGIATQRSLAAAPPFRKIVLAVDRPENSGRAVEAAIGLAAQNGAGLTILHVEPLGVPLIASLGFAPPIILPTGYFEGEEERARLKSRWLARLVHVAEQRGVSATMDLVDARDSIAEEVTRRADEEGADLIIIGAGESGRLERMVRGSMSSAIKDRADCPVLVVRGTRGGRAPTSPHEGRAWAGGGRRAASAMDRRNGSHRR